MTFSRIVCGIEPDGRGIAAARRAVRLAPEGVPLTLVGAADVEGAAMAAQPLGSEFDLAPIALIPPAGDLEHLQNAVRAELEDALRELADLPSVGTEVSVGPLAVALEEAAGNDPGVLVALDAPRESRFLGLIDGSHATWLLHESSHAVLLSRGPDDIGDFPRTIVVGLDGSPLSAAAARAAGRIATARGAELRVVVATGHGEDPARVAAARADLPAHELVESSRSPAHALAEAGGDLIVLGSRGHHGLRTLGSVSEKVSHGAAASVLIIH